MLKYTLVGLGSAVGAILRFWASGAIANQSGQSFLFENHQRIEKQIIAAADDGAA